MTVEIIQLPVAPAATQGLTPPRVGYFLKWVSFNKQFRPGTLQNFLEQTLE